MHPGVDDVSLLFVRLTNRVPPQLPHFPLVRAAERGSSLRPWELPESAALGAEGQNQDEGGGAKDHSLDPQKCSILHGQM